MRVLITDNNLGDSELERRILESALEAEVHVAQCATEIEVKQAVAQFQPDALVVQWAPITADVVVSMENCRFISRMGIGIDMIDLNATSAAGIEVRNVPHYCTEEVATHAISMLLALNRRLFDLDKELRAGVWDAAKYAPEIKKVSDSTLALIGLGRIGSIVAKVFSAMGAKVIAVDPVATGDGIERVDYEAVAQQADFISVHAPLLPDTHHVLDAEFFAACERNPIVVNTSRGPIIDTKALSAALQAGEVSAAGIDVFEQEPISTDESLLTAPNALLSPHAAWCSIAALPELRRKTAHNVVDYFRETSVA